jgi:hypothetical protein
MWPMQFTLADDARVRLDETDQLSRARRCPMEDAGAGLAQHLPRARNHGLERGHRARYRPPGSLAQLRPLPPRRRDRTLRLPHNAPRDPEQAAVGPPECRARGLAAQPQRLRDLPHPPRHAAPNIPQAHRHTHARGRDGPHRPAEHTDTVLTKAAVRRVADRRLDHRGIDAQLPPPRHVVGPGLGDHPLEHLLQHRPVEKLPQPHERLGIRNPPAAESAEVSVDDVAPHLPLELLVAPSLEVLEHQEP